MANAIGFGIGGLTMLPLLDEAFPNRIAKTTVVRIGVGTSTSEKTQDKDSLSGNIPGIRLFDVAGRLISDIEGSSKNKIADGSWEDIKLPASDDLGGRQAQYISVISGGTDAICVSYITVTWPDGLKESWMGNWGYFCGGSWYPAQTISNVQDDYTPKYTWIDSDGTNGIGVKGLGIHITDFTPTAQRLAAYQNDTFLVCDSKPRFWMYDDIDMDTCLPHFDPILKFKQKTLLDVDRALVVGVEGSKLDCNPLPPVPSPVLGERRNKNRSRSSWKSNHLPRSQEQMTNSSMAINSTSTTSTGPRSQSFVGRLITSKHTGHSAKELCASDTSVGPDFVSYQERVYCDMENKLAYPLCFSDHRNSTTVEVCFDIEIKILVDPKPINAREKSLPNKKYHIVEDW
ncbi:hypothetical protein BGAL_0054g00010 [Botrytis galanthina]|uniref:Uncharacterized protein n=1 Tax=Botrytis galanthina TaxID=278940 RepID=A0A4S8R6Q7_9HELO|nr:hypothetical protein BGAL_0054g00010 [Botrytis galanthina]